MGLDIRLPIGMMFSLLGPILLATGVLEGTSLNVSTGACMLAFGAAMLAAGLVAQRRAAAAAAGAPASAPRARNVE